MPDVSSEGCQEKANAMGEKRILSGEWEARV